MLTPAPLHPAPRWRTVANEQLRVVGLLLRGGGVLFLALLVALDALPVVQAAGAHSAIPGGSFANPSFSPEVSSVMAFVALFIPLMVWRDEEPMRRGYHWLMPISRRAHALARVVAGWLWTMAATLAFLLSIVVLTLIVGHIAGRPQPYHQYFRAWEWLVPFTSATICYLFASAAALGARRPLIWIFGVIAIYAGCVLVMIQRGMTELARPLMLAWSGYAGARAATFGVFPSPDGHLAQDPVRWIAASTLWGGAALLLVVLIASPHREGA